MRWWLGAAFALIAALTAVAVSQISLRLTERTFEDRREELAVGRTVRAASEIAADGEAGFPLRQAVARAERRLGLRITMVAADGTIGDGTGTRPALVTEAARAVRERRRFVATDAGSGRIVVGIRLDAPGAVAMVTVTNRSELSDALGDVRRATRIALPAAVILGLLVGVAASSLVTARLRRLRRAAGAIERGDFSHRLRPAFHDEVGDLGVSIDAMSERLGGLFATLEAERARLDRLMRRLHEGVVAIRPDGTLALANPAAERLLGAGPLLAGASPPDGEGGRILAEAVARATGEQAIAERLVERGDGSTLQVVSLRPSSPDEDLVVVIDDVTESVRRERAEREFVANAAHQLRGPLATISGAAQVLRDGAGDDPATRDRFVAHICRETGRLGRLVRTLLTLARVQTGQDRLPLTTVPLAPLLGAAAAAVPARRGRRVAVDVDPSLTVPGDEGLLEHAVANLVANADAHTPSGTIRLAARRHGPHVVIEVADSGTGISEEDLPLVFDRFYRPDGAPAEGFGLGLPIVRECITALGGEVALTSEPGTGTTVTITLPARPPDTPGESG